MLKTACGNGFPLNIPSVIPESGGSGGTSDYSDLTNKPQINSVTLSGNKSAADLGLASADIEDLIPADASSSNQLATAADLPGLATTSAAGLVQPDGTTITIADGVISAVGGAGNVNFAELPAVNLSELSWTQGTSGVYYAPVANVFPAGKKMISAVAYAYSGLSPSNYAIMFAQSESNPANLVLTSGTNQYTSAAISIRVGYV